MSPSHQPIKIRKSLHGLEKVDLAEKWVPAFAGKATREYVNSNSFTPQITRFSAKTESSPCDSPNSSQKISVLCSPISGARLAIRQGEPL